MSEAIFALLGVGVGVLASSINACLNRRHQLRLAALERRLDTHQQAYALWNRLRLAFHNKERDPDIVGHCQDWWNHNCLFLDPKARFGFREAFTNVGIVQDSASSLDPRTKKALWNELTAAGAAIEAGVGLPPIAEDKDELKGPTG